ncbi:uncharacterized protein LOC110093385 [Dendrobium catenatum]|uniref:uncharacterized protein LOC110093385 n=1 Tax=Dendrobium catenatum TaxID=906689 RepID=UPI00109FB33B|nr:uncharacterized protein LOC110093385 [Dendrobium catenatum]
MDRNWKETLVVLIPKVSNPVLPTNFRPISLCNSVYKVVAKLILNRLIPVVPKLISEEQAAFIKAGSGFRQGCPLSPILFILCSQLLSNALSLSSVGIKIYPKGPLISHLLYADDVLIYSEANRKEAKEIKEILDNFSRIDIGNGKKRTSTSWKIIKDGGKALNPILRWNVINGKSINTMEDNWILDRSIKKCLTFVIPHNEDNVMLDKFIQGGNWNIAELKKFFGADLVDLILQITINANLMEDE